MKIAMTFRGIACITCIAVSLVAGCAEFQGGHRDGVAAQIGEKWVRAELYCGMSRRDGSTVTDAQWQAFLDRYVTPRFPTGFTVLNASGQYQSMEDGKLYREPSRVLVILFPREFQADAERKLQQVAQDYIGMFEQESVLKVESESSVRFIERPAPVATQP